jgi:HTH-type transcriptional regulator / antitoxin HipB
MLTRTPADLGAVIRDRRKHLKRNQASLANEIGVSRQWLIELEHGHPRAELGLVLRVLDALGINLDAEIARAKAPRSGTVDINAIVAKAKKKKL